MNIVTRKEALAQHLRFYYTGKTCPQGHVSKKYAANKKCVECSNARYHGPLGDRLRAASREYWRKPYSSTTSRPCPAFCELCGKSPTGKQRKTLHLDHDHRTNTFRGWLCAGCNTGLGKLGDSVGGLSKALLYLINNTNRAELGFARAELEALKTAMKLLNAGEAVQRAWASGPK